MLKFEIEGLESIDNDFKSLSQEIEKSIPTGLKVVASDMVNVLQQYIQKEVYNKYSPKNYIRRQQEGGMISSENMYYNVSGNTLSFNYEFPTSPSLWAKVPYSSYSEFEDGDDAIKAIQTGAHYPTYGNIPGIKPRPFWNLFVLDYFGTGLAVNALVEGINSYNSKFSAQTTKSVSLESTDYAEIMYLSNTNAVSSKERITTN